MKCKAPLLQHVVPVVEEPVGRDDLLRLLERISSYAALLVIGQRSDHQRTIELNGVDLSGVGVLPVLVADGHPRALHLSQ